ncbi:hypothetical protein L1887_57168 [Cichorium endivia]|nr:hypothetical protein L1887_57168 [Cichorium endivia]
MKLNRGQLHSDPRDPAAATRRPFITRHGKQAETNTSRIRLLAGHSRNWARMLNSVFLTASKYEELHPSLITHTILVLIRERKHRSGAS